MNETNVGFSIIIPTYHEGKNLPDLARRISEVNFEYPFEVILADDNSLDNTPLIVADLSQKYPWLKLLTRIEKKRSLGQSVLEGFHVAKYPFLIVMDADLSHPPEEITSMLKILSDSNADIVIGSRYVKGGSTDDTWPLSRVFTSLMAAHLTQICLFINVKDPLSGFFAIRKSLLVDKTLNPIGWKIGLEILIRCNCKNIKEIPINFAQRKFGHSKLNFKTSFDYLNHLIHLMAYKITSYKVKQATHVR